MKTRLALAAAASVAGWAFLGVLARGEDGPGVIPLYVFLVLAAPALLGTVVALPARMPVRYLGGASVAAIAGPAATVVIFVLTDARAEVGYAVSATFYAVTSALPGLFVAGFVALVGSLTPRRPAVQP